MKGERFTQDVARDTPVEPYVRIESLAHANHITQLKRIAFGCADKADFENLTRLANELPKGSFRTEAVLAYRKAQLWPGANLTWSRRARGVNEIASDTRRDVKIGRAPCPHIP